MVQTEQGSGWGTAITARRVMIVAALFIIGYFSLSIVSNAVTHSQLTNRRAALEQEIDTLERREARLQALRAYTETDAFIEAVARENGYARPDEVAVVTVAPDAEAGSMTLGPGDPWWYRYLHPDDRR
ncbi:MAG: septum formation initiator family protein [Dehalococcoidia bacterium]